MLSACLFGLCPDRSSMAYYGIPSAAASLSATNSDDTISILGRSTTLTAQSVYGANGNDVISLAAVGKTAVASSTISVVSGIALSGGAKFTVKDIVTLVGASATTTLTGILTASARSAPAAFRSPAFSPHSKPLGLLTPFTFRVMLAMTPLLWVIL